MASDFAFSHTPLRLTTRGRLSVLALICLGGIVLSLGAAGPARAQSAPQADLSVTKSGDEAVAVGGTITYTLVVTNGGPEAATNVVLADPIPAHTTFVSADSETGTVSFADNILTVSFGSLPAFESGTATLVLSVNGDTPRDTNISNTATASADTADPEPSNNSATALTVVTGPFPGDLLISEFRLRGPGGAADEYVEVHNNADTPHLVSAFDGSDGYAVAASDGVIRCTIPNGTRLPGRGHYLCVNSAGYSLAAYPAGADTTATGDADFTDDIPDNAGLALFRTANPANFTAANRLDAVGSTAVTDALYREGAGYPALAASSTDYAFYRDLCGKGGSTTTMGACPTGGRARDTDNNAADFILVDTSGPSSGRRLGAPGPENLSAPPQSNGRFAVLALDATKTLSAAPNRVRDTTPDPANNSDFGTLDVRRRVVNLTGASVTRLRFRVVDISTFPVPSGFADLRPRTSLPAVVTGVGDRATCQASNATTVTPCAVTVQGTTLEQPPAQAHGGGFNSSLSADTVRLATPLLPGESINVRFLLGLRQTGTFKFFINVEALADEAGGESLGPAGRPAASK